MESVAKAMARFLEAHGVELVVGQSLPSALHLELPDTKIRQLQVRTENAGAAICDAYAKNLWQSSGHDGAERAGRSTFGAWIG